MRFLIRPLAEDGIIDSVASDHSPSTPDVKLFDTGDFLKAWGGFAGESAWSLGLPVHAPQ